MGCTDTLLDPLGVLGPTQEELQKSNAKAAIGQSADFYNKFLAQFIEPAKSAQDMAWDVALGYAQDAPGIVNKGYDRAALGIDRMVSQGRSDILDEGSNVEASINQAMASSGLFGSTAHAGAVSGVSSGTARALGQLYADAGGQYSALEQARTSGLLGANQNLSALQVGRAGHELGFLGTQLSAAMGAPVFAQSGGPHPALAFGAELLKSLPMPIPM